MSASSLNKSSIRATVKARILNAIANVAADRRIVLLDPLTVKIVDAVCTMNDILDNGAFLIETVTKGRQAYPAMHAVYFLQPSKEAITAIGQDFKKKLYKGAHLLFTSEVSQELFSLLASSPAGPLVGTFQELYLNFIAFESRVFHLNAMDSFSKIFKPNAGQSTAFLEELDRIAHQIVSACVTMNELPTIRYRKSDNDTITAKLAVLVQEELDNYASRNSDFAPSSSGELLIVDRTHDLLAPLLHEFTYQAMAHDLLDIKEGNRYEYKITSGAGEVSTRTVALDESDSLWSAMRHTHIADCSNLIITRFNKFVSENKAASKGKASTAAPGGEPNVTSLGELRETMNALGEFQELKAEYSLHLTIAQECMNASAKKNLTDVATVEQNMATGVDSDGDPVKDIWAQLVPLLDRTNISSSEKARLIMLYLLTQPSLSEQDRRAMFEHAKLDAPDLEAIRHMSVLSNDAIIKRPVIKKADMEESTYDVSRYVPALKNTLKAVIRGDLSPTDYPLVKQRDASRPAANKAAPVSLRNKGPAAGAAAGGSGGKDSSSKFVMTFVVGGMTHSEMRAIYELSESAKTELFIGSTHILTPKQYMDDLCQLK